MRLIDAEPLEGLLRSRCAQCSNDYGSLAGSISGCLKLVQAQPTIAPPPNAPLTLEELREMDGEPVYLDLGDGGAWVLLRVQQGKVFVTHKNTICVPVNILFECGGKAYRRRPEDENI